MPRFLIDVNLPYRFGNMRMREFHVLISRLWPSIVDLSAANRLIRVYQDRIEAVE